MKIDLDEHGILEFTHEDQNKYTWHNYSVMLTRAQCLELKQKIENHLLD